MGLGAELHVASRFLIGTRRWTSVVTVTLISLLGLGVGVFALVVTLALLDGFQSGIRSQIEVQAAHAEVRPVEGRRLADPEELALVLQGSLTDVEIVQVVRGIALVSSDTDAVPASVVGRSDTDRVAVDRVLARRLSLGAGATLDLISARQRLTPMGPLPVRVRAQVSRIVDPRPGTEGGSVILPLDRAQRLLWGEEVIGAIELRDPVGPWTVGRRAREVLGADRGAVEVAGLQELHRPLLTALALEKVMIFVAVGLMLVVAALNLLCNVAMVAAQKRKDLAVMAGLGFDPSSLRRLFVLLGLIIGAAGSLLGAGLGSAVAVVLDRTGLLELPQGVFVVAAVPFRVDPATVGMVVAVALGLAAVAAWLPARMVARREPSEGLRYE
ncbi:MAG: FtsX-like permease family protein [Thermoanaerobaculales bacterium]|jgi:lipoprotein-releasing system permease protein|nr:FtsX-like permease family protein [Thermoanaerobaculales bacterium]